MVPQYRAATHAGTWYPNGVDCARDVAKYLTSSGQEEVPNLRFLIAPHAGYSYSGPVAGHSFAAIPKDQYVL
ncbi:MEMO1 family protein [Kipferlia bialata]|uniref:MEMO1 family protein n=1 Tax=Kipferlia bialata TaxID=797122 RepID=A0A9K3CT95_9EUKA|nr:MEMO1 family protein [Kipferlia bialata]|eukprot:g3042.t1